MSTANDTSIVGVWAVRELIHMFSNDLGRIPAGEFKNDDTGTSFGDMRFVFDEDGTYRVYADSLCTDLKHSGCWYCEDGCFYYDPIIADGLPPDRLDSFKELRLNMGELTVNLMLIILFLRRVED